MDYDLDLVGKQPSAGIARHLAARLEAFVYPDVPGEDAYPLEICSKPARGGARETPTSNGQW